VFDINKLWEYAKTVTPKVTIGIADPDDILMDAMCRLLEAIAHGFVPEEPEGYIRLLLFRVTCDTMRRGIRRKSQRLPDDLIGKTEEGGEDRDLILSLWGYFTEDQREIVTLVLDGSLDFDDRKGMAARLNKTRGAVNAAIYRLGKIGKKVAQA